MLSNPLHRFSAYNTLPSSNMLSNGGHLSSHMHSNGGLDPLSHGGQYALQQLQQHVDVHQNSQVHRNHNSKHRQHPYGPSNGRGVSGTSGPIRRRISRACDQCNQLRTKCDGQSPCAHCVEFGLGCEYIRERKKRGKASRKDLAQQAAAAAANGNKSPTGQSSDDHSPTESRNGNGSSSNSVTHESPEFQRPSVSRSLSLNTGGLDKTSARDVMKGRLRAGSLESLTEIANGHQQAHLGSRSGSEQVDSPSNLSINGYPNLHSGYRSTMNPHMMNGEHSSFAPVQGTLPGYSEMPYAIQSPTTHYPVTTSGPFRLGDSSLPSFPMAQDTSSPGGWMAMGSPTNQFHHTYASAATSTLRYPVLQPLVPHLNNIIPLSLACELLDMYFASSSAAMMHPTSPYILGYVFRKQSFLHPTKPRHCTPALLASMLWVVAQTSDAALLTTPPAARARICKNLLELTVNLLKPLIHNSSPTSSESKFDNFSHNGVSLGVLGVAMPGTVTPEAMSGDTGAFGAAGSLDDVVTYVHLATVVSASEYKGASIRWWNAAWSLARELKLGRELPQNSPSMSHHPAEGGDVDADGEADDDVPITSMITEEEREERRRVWWLVFAVDRHLALCYNRPLFLLDIECDGLLQPMDDTEWQENEFYNGDSSLHITSPNGAQRIRRRGPNFECTGHSIFNSFLPLMTILGEVVDLYHAKNHPRFGMGFRSTQEWDDHASEIARNLDIYGQSLKEFEAMNLSVPNPPPEDPSMDEAPHAGTPSMHSVHSAHSHRTAASVHPTEADIQTKIVVAYGTHVMHVLHILLTGKWDPISLLDDNDLWISSQSFLNATSHAVSAAEAIKTILDLDPGLEHMPFFFGVYLLQGSFLLLLIADKLQVEASPEVVKACETIVRAHEACVVTLNTEYQRNFRKVMRSALAQVRGRIPEDFGEQQLKRREVLALYRWTGDGTGLAL